MKPRTPAPRLAREGFVSAAPAKAVARTHMLCPKPRDRSQSMPPLPEEALAWLIGRAIPSERKALAQIVETADLVMIDGEPWLVIPALGQLLDRLAAFQAEAEDREPDVDTEGEDADTPYGSGAYSDHPLWLYDENCEPDPLGDDVV